MDRAYAGAVDFGVKQALVIQFKVTGHGTSPHTKTFPIRFHRYRSLLYSFLGHFQHCC